MSIQPLSSSMSSYIQTMRSNIALTPIQQQAALKLVAIILVVVTMLTAMWHSQRSLKQVKVIQNGNPEEWMSLDKVNGQAKITFASFWGSGATCEGTFKDGKLNGHGKVIHALGAIESEEGEYVENDLHGQGTVKYRNGLTIAGDFDHSRVTWDKWYSGQLTITHPNGTVEQGKFVNGQLV